MKRPKRKVVTVSAEQIERWTERAQYLGYGSVSEWARVMLLRAKRDEPDADKVTRRNKQSRELANQARADRVRATIAGENEAFAGNLTLHLTADEHTEIDRDDFSAWARAALDAAAQY